MTKTFLHIISTALATASSLHTLSIPVTTFSLAPNSFHPSTLSIINLYILTLSSATYSSHICVGCVSADCVHVCACCVWCGVV